MFPVLLSTLLLPALALTENGKSQEKGKGAPTAGPAVVDRGFFRVVINGFKVNNESDDDILENDGKRDEVYLRADIWVLNRNREVSSRRTLKSKVMGDVNNQEDPPRIRAGSGSDLGGLRTNDKWPIDEPWRRVRAPLTDRVPMLVWEGLLQRGQNMTVIAPTVWEWDSVDVSASERAYENGRADPGPDREYRGEGNRGINEAFNSQKSNFAAWIADNSSSFMTPNSAFWLFLDSKAGTRPIGINRDVRLRTQVLTLTYDSAISLTRTSPANLGLGILALNYADETDHGNYTLYVQVELVR
jgi:hypothetical protein